MNGSRRLGGGLLGLVMSAVVVLQPAPAWAHSQLVSTSPANGALVSGSPQQIVLTFDENVQDIGDVVIVTGPNGGRFDTGKPTVVDRTATQPLEPLPYRGHYSVTCRVVSADGHPLTGTLGFTLTAGATAPPATVQPPDGADEPVDSGTGGALAAGAAVLVACAVAGWWLSRRGRGASGQES